MRSQRVIYWISTTILAGFMFVSAAILFIKPEMMEQVNKSVMRWGYPIFFHYEWEIAKILGALVLVIPAFGQRFKGFAYSGFLILLVSALITHLIAGDPVKNVLTVSFFLVILIISYAYYNLAYPTTKSTNIRR